VDGIAPYLNPIAMPIAAARATRRHQTRTSAAPSLWSVAGIGVQRQIDKSMDTVTEVFAAWTTGSSSVEPRHMK
jgi:hypothetical protein